MAVYRFRISFEDYDDIVRIIEIKANQTFEDLQQALHAAIGFETAREGSFFLSDDNWKKGQEISSRPAGENPPPGFKPMKEARFSDTIADPHQKIYYVYDTEAQWGFHIELVKIMVAEENGARYPRCVKTAGEAPKQFGSTVLGAIPDPEDFDGEASDLYVDDEDLAESTSESDEPIEVNGDASDELETADSDDLDDDSPVADDFN
jgi:hypothetical protein